MNKYTKPEMNIKKFDVSDIITSSGEVIPMLTTWGSVVKVINSENVPSGSDSEETFSLFE